MRPMLIALPACACLAACEKAVEIVSPQTYNYEPVREVTVKFSKNFKPGSFTAKIDGADITGLFVPAPAPGGQSTAQLPADDCGFFGGEGPRGSPTTDRAVGVDGGDRDHSPSSGAVVQQVPTGSNSSGSPIPQPPAGLSVFWHRVVVDGSCKTPLICEGDERQFLPLHLVGVPLQLPVRLPTPTYFEVEAWPKAVVALPVKVRTETPSIRLNGGQPGASTSTIVPAGGRSGQIRVDGEVRPSSHSTWLCSPGVQRGRVVGDVR